MFSRFFLLLFLLVSARQAISGTHFSPFIPQGQTCEFESVAGEKHTKSVTVDFPDHASLKDHGKIRVEATGSAATVFICRDEENTGRLHYCIGNEGTSFPTQVDFYGLEPGSLMVVSTLRPLFLQQIELGIENLNLQRVSIHVYQLVGCRAQKG